MDISIIIKNIKQIVEKSLLENSIKQSYLNKLDTIECRGNDPNLYVGIVGEFSSGKSTFINALIGKDYFVTNCIQGTTTVITSIKYGNVINLELRYKNGNTIKYNNDKLSLIKLYLPDVYSELSFNDKLKINATDLFGYNKKDELMLRIFDIVTTSNEISKGLDEVIVYYPSDFLRRGIVIIDTPGTDSLVPMHVKITKNAILNKCDLALVVIPSNSPVSSTLSEFVADNLAKCLNDCYFLITKIELIRNDIERAELIESISIRLRNNLEIDNPRLIAAPTLLSLEERNIVEKSGILNHLSSEERKKLTNAYNKEIDILLQNIINNKHKVLLSTLRRLLEDLKPQILMSLNDLLNSKESSLSYLQSHRTITLDSFFESSINQKELYSTNEIAISKLKSYINETHRDFERFIFSIISSANSKDEIQNVMNLDRVITEGIKSNKECYDQTLSQISWLINYYSAIFLKLSNKFGSTYNLAPIDFILDVSTEFITHKNYNKSFSKWNLTTGLVRMFVNKESIRAEMCGAVKRKLEKSFNNLIEYYIPPIIKINKKISKQVEKTLILYTKTYRKAINERIELEAKEEQKIKGEISMITSHINQIKNINITL